MIHRLFLGIDRNILVLCAEGKKPTSFARNVASFMFPGENHIFYLLGIYTEKYKADISDKGWASLFPNITFDLIISEFCPIYNLKDDTDSAFSINTMNQIEQLVSKEKETYLVIPTTPGDQNLFEINLGDTVHLVPSRIADLIDVIHGRTMQTSYNVAFVSIAKLLRTVRKWVHQDRYKNDNKQRQSSQQRRQRQRQR